MHILTWNRIVFGILVAVTCFGSGSSCGYHYGFALLWEKECGCIHVPCCDSDYGWDCDCIEVIVTCYATYIQWYNSFKSQFVHKLMHHGPSPKRGHKTLVWPQGTRKSNQSG